jgi:hypothetical protein
MRVIKVILNGPKTSDGMSIKPAHPKSIEKLMGQMIIETGIPFFGGNPFFEDVIFRRFEFSYDKRHCWNQV